MASTETLNLDDLIAPVLTHTQRQILDYTESREVTFDLDAMLAEAVSQAGADDLADDDGFAERLAAHVAAIESDTGLRQLIRGSLRARVVRKVRNRLSLTDLFKRYPEIDAIPIERPLIVVADSPWYPVINSGDKGHRLYRSISRIDTPHSGVITRLFIPWKIARLT